MFLEDDQALARPLQDDLETAGLATACIDSPEDQAAGLAFGPDMIVVNPETSAKDAFGLFPKAAQAVPSVPFIVGFSQNPALSRAMNQVARQHASRIVAKIDRPYSIPALTDIAEKCRPDEPRDDTGDEAFIKALIRKERLIPNLAVEFQSKHDLKTNAIVGFEALTRLRPRRAINPEMIFSQLVDVDVECAATEVVIDTAARFGAALQLAGRSHTVSLNCSAAVLASGGFIRRLDEAIRRYRIAPKRLVVEITEDSRLADIDVLTEKMHALERLGVGIAIDDFGTGMANLDRVSRLPFSELKIDKSIFWACAEGRLPMSMLTGILEFCRSRRTKSVIEGVETQVQLAHAKLLGADYGQGFYWGRAAPPQFLVPVWR
ncbi:MAG: EAL domain-containing protein [Pseudomonadota bacterium]